MTLRRVGVPTPPTYPRDVVDSGRACGQFRPEHPVGGGNQARLPQFYEIHRAGAPLTPRQLEALRWAADGLQRREVAERMGITSHGVHMLLRGAYARLSVDGLIDAFRALGWLVVR